MAGRHLILLLLLMGVVSAQADIVDLGEGETFSGGVVRARDGALVFRTTLKGQMMMPLDTVSALSTDSNLVVSMKDDTVYYGRLGLSEKRQVLVPLDGGAPQPIRLADVEEIVVIPSPPSSEDPSALEEWRASVGTGILGRTGNRDYVDGFMRLKLGRKTAQANVSGELFVQGGSQDRFPVWLLAEGTAEGAAGDRARPFVTARLERDTDRALDLRTDFTLGLNLPVLTAANQNLTAAAGGNVAYEEWELPGYLSDGRVSLVGESDRKYDVDLNAQLGLRYSRVLFGASELDSTLDLYPSLSDPGDVRARNQTALTVPLSNRLRLRLDVLLDYNNHPEFRQLKEWSSSVGASVQWDF